MKKGKERFLKFAVCTIGLWVAPGWAAVRTEVVSYRDGLVELEGVLAYDDSVSGRRPGVVVVHDWMGRGAFSEARARELASLGYVAFAADIYGKGRLPKNPEQAGKLAAQYKTDRAKMRSRARAALDVLARSPRVDPRKLGAMGYCFGGTVALELARSGAPLRAVVSFHGGLDTPNPGDAQRIQAHVLALHGADDPIVPPADVHAFEEEMRAAKLDWELIQYGKAVHAFTNPEAGSDPSRGTAYNAVADHRSWRAMKDFFAETLGR